MLVTHALCPMLAHFFFPNIKYRNTRYDIDFESENGRSEEGNSQTPKRKNKQKRNLLPHPHIKTPQLMNGQNHNNNILRDRKPRSNIRQYVDINTTSLRDERIPQRIDGDALEDDSEEERESVGALYEHGDFDDCAEAGSWEEAQEEEEDGEFGDVLYKDVEYFGDV